jgi:hypothetical protein
MKDVIPYTQEMITLRNNKSRDITTLGIVGGWEGCGELAECAEDW